MTYFPIHARIHAEYRHALCRYYLITHTFTFAPKFLISQNKIEIKVTLKEAKKIYQRKDLQVSPIFSTQSGQQSVVHQ